MRKNKTNPASKEKEPESEAPVREAKKPSLAAKLLKGWVYFFFFLFVLIAGIGLVLEYYFPAEEIRVLAEKEGTRQLKLPLAIKKIKFSLLSGIRVDGLVLGPSAKPIASVQTMLLDYDLSQLIQGHLVINQVLIDQPQVIAISQKGVWNFQPLLDLGGSKNTPAPSTTGTPALPLTKIDLQQLKIQNIGATLVMDDQISAIIKGLSLEAKGKAGRDKLDLTLRVLMHPEKDANILFKNQKEKLYFESKTTTDLTFSARDLNKLNVSGRFGFNENQVKLGDALPSPDLEGSLSAEVQLQPERIHLSAFSLKLDDKNKIAFSTKIKNFSTAPAIETQIEKVSFRLSDILRWGAKWLPPISGNGTLEAENLGIQAELPGFKPENISLKGGSLSTRDLALDYSDFKIHIRGLDSSLKINEAILKKGKPAKVSAELKMQLVKGRAEEAEIRNWKQKLTLDAGGPELSKIKMGFNTDIGSLHYQHPLSKKVSLPFHAKGSLSGDLKRGDLKLQKISYQSGKFLKGNLSGEVKEKKSVQLQKGISLNISEALKILPREISSKIPKAEASGQTQVSFSVSGKLNSKFQPTHLHTNAEINLNQVSAKLDEPRIEVEGLNTSLTFPLDYEVEHGVKIPILEIETKLKHIQALNNWNLKNFSSNIKLNSESFYNLKSDFGTLPVKLNSQIKLGKLISTQPELSLADFKTDALLKGDLRPNDFRNSRLEGKVSIQNLNALKKIQVGKVDSQFSLQVHDKSLSRIHLSQKTKVTSINEDDLKLSLKEMSIESLSRKDLLNGNFDLDKFRLNAPGLVAFHLKGNAKNWGENFELENTVDGFELASILRNIPEDTKKSLGIKDLGGKIRLTFQTHGELPPANNKDLKPFERWKKLFASLGPNNLPPLEISSRFQLLNGKAGHLDKNIRGVNLETQLNFKNGSANLSGKTSGNLQGMEIFETLPLYPEFEFHYQLENLNTLILAKHQLNLKNRGLSHKLGGKVDGLKVLLKGPFELPRILKNINIALNNEINLKIEKEMKEELFGNINARGELYTVQKIKQVAGERIDLEGQLGFNHFSAEIPSVVELKNLTGNFPFSKSLLLSSDSTSENAVSPAQKRFYKQLREFSRYKNNIKMDSLEISGQKIENIGMDAVFKDNRLTADKFIFDVLGGTVGGHFSFTQTSSGPTLKFVTEFAKIDSSRLLPQNQEKNIDSKIDGNMEIAVQVETADVSLDKLSLKIAITKIGAETLDRLLLYIDPEESKPAIVDTRAKLKIATPHRVLISLENGNLNMEAWLKSDLLGIIKAPELKRIPVAGLKQFAAINEKLHSLKGTLELLNIVAAKRIVFENEKPVFKN